MPQKTYVHTLTEKAEDYLEAILNVAATKGYARTKDVAAELNVSPSSVVEMFQKLDAIGLVEYRKYEGVVLTPRGRQVAETIKYRHDALLSLLLLVGVPQERAQKDACAMEHELSEESIEKIRMFVEYMNSHGAARTAVRDYHAYCRVRHPPLDKTG
jgi:DtxR family Mn-dependent transcriptional regulator